MKINHILLIYFLLLCHFGLAQNPKIINNQATLFELYESGNSINFIITETDLTQKKPIFLWCQGSLPYPLFVETKEQGIWMIGGGITNFDYQKISEKYHLVIISMPETPVIADESQVNSSYWYSPEGNKPTDEFLRNDYLENYVERAEAVLKFLEKKDWVDNSKLVVAGHSQGSKIAEKIAATNEKATHLGLFSPNPFGRIDQSVRQSRKDAENGAITWEDAEKEMEEYYDFYKKAIDDEERENDPSLVAWKSFSEPFIDELSQLRIPVFMAYGTADVTSDLCDLVPLYFIKNKNENLTFKRYIGLDHNYFETSKNGMPNYEKGHWKEVMENFLNWTFNPTSTH